MPLPSLNLSSFANDFPTMIFPGNLRTFSNVISYVPVAQSAVAGNAVETDAVGCRASGERRPRWARWDAAAAEGKFTNFERASHANKLEPNIEFDNMYL